MRCSEPDVSVVVAIVASVRRVAELGSLGRFTHMNISDVIPKEFFRLFAALLFSVLGFYEAIAVGKRDNSPRWCRARHVLWTCICAVAAGAFISRHFGLRDAPGIFVALTLGTIIMIVSAIYHAARHKKKSPDHDNAA
jgi:hypothetical protein